MKKVTIKNRTYDADYAGVGYLDMLKMQVKDTRLLSVIAPDMEGADHVAVEDGDTAREYDGYTILNRIERIDQDSGVVILAKEGGDTQ